MKINKPYALNETGRRQNQEDSIFPAKEQADSSTHLFLVCDGMGGHENGEVASQTVCESFALFLKDVDPESFSEAIFEQALAYTYGELDKKDNLPESKSKMGTTLTLLHLSQKEAFMAHIGDSRIYHLRTSGGKAEIIYKTSDHSLVNELLRADMITEEEAENHPKKNVITRAVQPNMEKRCKADVHRTTDVKAGDYFFLCSDGVVESLSDNKLIEILSQNIGDDEKIKEIYQLCNAHSSDNFSAYLIPVTEGIAETAELATTSAEMDADVTAPPIIRKGRWKVILWIVVLVIIGVGAYFFMKCGGLEVKN